MHLVPVNDLLGVWDGLSVATSGVKAIETGMISSIMDMKKNTFMCFFHRPIFTKIREFATSVLWKLVVHFGYRGRNWKWK